VIRYAILYFTLFFLFIVLNLPIDTLPMQLMQPTNLKNNDTTSQTTGTILGAAETGAAATSGGSSSESSAAARRFAHFMY
jgi:1,3-beta-glucan synthase